MSNFLSAFCFLFLLLISSAPPGLCKKNSTPGDSIEEVDGKKLERLIRTEEYLAVYFYTKWCKDCIPALEALEVIQNDARNFGVSVVRNSEKATAKKHGVTAFPALVYFRNQQPATYDGDLKDSKRMLSWLTDLDSVELPDKIEEVNVKILDNLIEESDFLAVLIYKEKSVNCRKVLLELENIDDEAHARGIGLVKISDERLAAEYGIVSFPALVYFRKKIPLLYDGDLYNEEELLNWLIEFQDLGEALEAIEEVTPNALAKLIDETPYLAVLFYDIETSRSQRILEELESIDDNCDSYGISFVKIDDDRIAAEYGIDHLPALVYFENKMPNFYQGDLTREAEVLEWLVTQTKSDEIEDVTERVLRDMIKNTHELAVLFYDNEDEAHQAILTELENIDDDADKLGIPVVKIDNVTLAEAYGVKTLPTLVFFENQVPNYYKGNLTTEEAVLEWLKQLKESDRIEIVSDEVVELMIDKCDFLAVLFYSTEDVAMLRVIEELENIDDESDKAGIPLIRSQSKTIAEDYGITFPSLVYFEDGVPGVYSGDLTNEDAVLKFLLDRQSRDEIEDVSSKALEQMIEKTEQLVVLFYNKNDKKSEEVLRELENIDEEADEEDLPFVRIHDEKLAREFGLDSILPVLVYFEKQIPSVYHGDLTKEEQVWKWLHMQLTSDGIEEVTEKILYNLVSHNPYLAVIFYDPKSKKSAKVLKEIETIDETADQYDILIVKNFHFEVAQKYGIKKLPALIFFKAGTPVVFEGNLMKEEEVLDFLLAQLVNDEIEDVNENILDQLVETTESVAVFFYDKDASISHEILKELEQIDSHTEKVGIPFVRIDDDEVAKEFGVLDELPILVYFENKIPSVYEGDLMKEEEVLAWILKNKEEDTIEEVTDEILGTMLKEYEYVLVFFAPNDCKDCDKILKELENIDDDTDHHGIMFVTTDDMNLAKKEAQITQFPALVLFRNGVPMDYKGQRNLVKVLQDGKFAAEIQGITKQKYTSVAGDMVDEDTLLKFVTSEEALDIPDKIDDVNTKMLDHLLNTSDYVAVLFYKEGDAECAKVLVELEDIDDDAEAKDIDVVKISDADTIEEYDIKKFPTLIFFKKRLPLYYDGDLMNEQKVLKWLVEQKQKKDDNIEYVDKKVLEVLMNDVDHIVVYFYGKVCAECKNIIQELEKIDEVVDKLGMHFVKTDDMREAEELGVTHFPTLVYFEHSVPSIYTGDLMNSQGVLEWLTKQKKEDTIENVNREMLFMLIEEQEFLAVFFYAENDKESEEALHQLEKIDDDSSIYDIHLVQMSDKIIAKKHGIQKLPGLVLFRNGKPVKFEGNLKNDKEVLDWLTSPAIMSVTDIIEKVNVKMLERVLEKFEFVTVFLYKKVGCKLCGKVLDELEKIDHEAQEENIHIVKIDDKGFAKKYGVYSFPAVLFFQGPKSKPVVYAGDMKNGERMLNWLMAQKDPSYDVIEEVEGKDLLTLIDLSEHLAVFYYDKKLCSNCDAQNIDSVECEDCQIIMDELESIDDDAYRSGIQFVKTPDLAHAKKHGVKSIPALVYFEDRKPSIYEGDLDDDEEVLQWLLHQKTDDSIEKVNGASLDKLIKDTEYLAVFISKPHCHACELALTELENIDDDTEKFGIQVVRISDLQVSKKYGIKQFPALIYFRNGNPLIYDGDLKDEHAVLEWLIDDDNRELRNEIESVNLNMLVKLVEESPILAVYFYNESRESERVLMELEKIDDECDQFGIDLVKVSDPDALKKFKVKTIPSLAFFRKQKALFYDGDLEDEETLLKWLTSNDVFEIKDEIEEVNREMVEKLLEDNELVAVLFYGGNDKSKAVLAELEHIDDEADALDIMFLKIMDPVYAKKFGITRVPALVYFRKRIPLIYQGNLLNEEEVLLWLGKDSHRHSEVNIFVYGLIGVCACFVIYAACQYCQKKSKTD